MQLSEAIAVRWVADVQRPHLVTHTFRKGGFGYLRSKMDGWRQTAQHQVMLVLTDLDRANCVVELRDQWLADATAPNLLLRIEVREVESWVLADHSGLQTLIGTKCALPVAPGNPA